MPCVDSRSEEEIIEQGKYIKELIGDETTKKISNKALGNEISKRYTQVIDDIESTSKTDLLNNALKSVELAKILSLDQDNTVLQKKAYYNALMDLGALLYDHKNHIYGDHLSALTERIKNNKLFSTAYNLYYLLQNKGSSAAEDLKRYSTLEFDAIWL